MKLLQICTISLMAPFVLGQSPQGKSIHQEQSEYYDSIGKDHQYYEENYVPTNIIDYEKSNCNLDKKVFGWHPYWNNGKEANYQWDLMSDLSYFGYDVIPSSGNSVGNNASGFATANAVTQALANGVKVNLCVTLFSQHDTFFNSSSAQQTLITNLISYIQDRGAHGVNIDFENLLSSHKIPFRNFVKNLSNQMKAAVPGAQISVALHAVEWSEKYDISFMNPYVDLFCIMGYDYYYGGSANAGPTDPLYHFGNTYNYTLSRSVTYYLKKGVPENKMILAVPYYGRQWPVANYNIPATTTSGTPSSVTYSGLKDNSARYNSSNRHVENASNSVYYNYTVGSQKYQCFISEEAEMKSRLDFIRKRNLAGMGIWALGNDDGYPQFWNAIDEYMTDCFASPCNGTITDIGGGEYKSYYDNEDYVYTIAPASATSIDVQFQSFDLKPGDQLYIYDGPNVNSPQIAGSPFIGTALPSNFTTTGGAFTVKFKSNGSNVGQGFKATYACTTIVVNPPITKVDTVSGWKSTNYDQSFLDTVPGSTVKKRYYMVGDHDGTEWRANGENGFFLDNFDDFTLHSDWTIESGTWAETNVLKQSDETDDNTNIHAPVNQSLSNQHLYHWKGKMGGAGDNRRAGLHIFIDDPTQEHRKNSYFVYFRLDDNQISFYKVEDDVFGGPKVNIPYVFNDDTWYDYKLIYDRVSGEVWIYVNDVLEATWIDPEPIETGDHVSFRSGNCTYEVDDFMVYRSRYPSVQIRIGAGNNKDIRYQNPSPSQPSGMIRSLVTNSVNAVSNSDSILVNVDWTAPAFNYINDGTTSTDVDEIISPNTLVASANWSVNDPNSGMVSNAYAIGTQAGDNSIVDWTSVALDSAVSIMSHDFIYNELYFFSVKARNGAVLTNIESSNGFRILATAGLNEGNIEIPKIYPNPASSVLNVAMSKNIEELGLYDMNGKLLKKVKVDSKAAEIDVSSFSAGTYVLRLKTKSQSTEHTWIKK